VALAEKTVTVIGGGAAGLAAALDLARLGVQVEIVELAPFLGGNAAGFVCKATERCVKCGACMVEERLKAVVEHPGIRVTVGARVDRVQREERFTIELTVEPAFIDPERCTACGACTAVCPDQGAITRSPCGHNRPPLALVRENCRHFRGDDCSRCREACPEGAIDLEKTPETRRCAADAVVAATGFTPFHPGNKPYGYGRFADVVTNLELEGMLRASHLPACPSDGRIPEKIAFIQCVGSRDATLNHLWCSKVCCGSAARMARLIKARRPETDITLFYIDIQTFGRDFDTVYPDLRQTVRMKRVIPADIFETEDRHLAVSYFDNEADKGSEEVFDMVILSVGLTPGNSTAALAKMLAIPLAETGFAGGAAFSAPDGSEGVFTAGTARGPMSIAEAIADAGDAVWQAVRYLNQSIQR
jgi:heterodisulfide reductase subunit A